MYAYTAKERGGISRNIKPKTPFEKPAICFPYKYNFCYIS